MNKMCFCIGPENCSDSNCEIVKRHRANKVIESTEHEFKDDEKHV